MTKLTYVDEELFIIIEKWDYLFNLSQINIQHVLCLPEKHDINIKKETIFYF